MKDSYYELIGVARDATQENIEAACLHLGEKFRPDRQNTDEATLEAFGEIERAYAVLSDPIARRAYDARLDTKASTKFSSGNADVTRPTRSDLWDFVWHSRSLAVKIAIVLIAVGMLGFFLPPTVVQPERTKDIAQLKAPPQQMAEKRAPLPPVVNRPTIGSGYILNANEADLFSTHVGRVADQRPISDLLYRDSLIQSAQITLAIVVKIIDTSPVKAEAKDDCKERFAETLLRSPYIKNFYDTYQRRQGTQSTRDVEAAILEALRSSVGCNI